MTESDLKLIDFHVTDITCHVNTGVSEELPMSIKSSVSARMPEEFDGSLYIYLKTTITGQDESLFLLDVLTETIVRLPEGKTELDENALHHLRPPPQLQGDTRDEQGHGHRPARSGKDAGLSFSTAVRRWRTHFLHSRTKSS